MLIYLWGVFHFILKEFNKDVAPPLPPGSGLAVSFAFRPGACGPIQSILNLKASTSGSSFLSSTPGVLGGGRRGALFMGLDAFINQREIAAGGRWPGGGGAGHRVCYGVKRELSVEGQRCVRGGFHFSPVQRNVSFSFCHCRPRTLEDPRRSSFTFKCFTLVHFSARALQIWDPS